MKIKLNGTNHTLRFVEHLREDYDAWGDHDDDNHIIRIDKNASEKITLDTIIHECLHGICPYLDESPVESGATELAEVLWELGYRRAQENEDAETEEH